MKKAVTAVFLSLLLVLLCASAHAEVLGMVSEEGDVYIQRLIIQGQELIFTSLEEDISMLEKDVNFDGKADLLLTTRLGASNVGQLIYLATDEGYQPASCGLVWNMFLDEERGLLISQMSNGMAGALTEYSVYRWDGLTPVKLRDGSSREKETFVSTAEGYEVIHYSQVLTRRVWDYTSGVPNGELIWEDEITSDELNIRERFDAFHDALLQGL